MQKVKTNSDAGQEKPQSNPWDLWSEYCLIGIANAQAFILSLFAVIGCVPAKKCIIVGEVAQLKQAQRTCQLEAV